MFPDVVKLSRCSYEVHFVHVGSKANALGQYQDLFSPDLAFWMGCFSASCSIPGILVHQDSSWSASQSTAAPELGYKLVLEVILHGFQAMHDAHTIHVA